MFKKYAIAEKTEAVKKEDLTAEAQTGEEKPKLSSLSKPKG